MNSETPSSSKEMMPFVILAICFISILAWLSARQPAATGGAQADGGAAFDQYLEFQIKTMAAQHTELEASKGKLERFLQTNLPRLDEQVAKAKKNEIELEKLVVGLMDLAKTDADAKAIVTRYSIQQSKPAKQ